MFTQPPLLPKCTLSKVSTFSKTVCRKAVALVGIDSIVGISMLVGGAAARLLLRYVQATMTQLAQVVVCNRHHCLDHRLCRLLLSTLDRLNGDREFRMTQELMASALGVRREGVTEAALNLQRAGLIHYERGRMRVLDRVGLECRTGECYAVVRREYERLLPCSSVQ